MFVEHSPIVAAGVSHLVVDFGREVIARYPSGIAMSEVKPTRNRTVVKPKEDGRSQVHLHSNFSLELVELIKILRGSTIGMSIL
jgi:hypothetical protein